jgi:hypothetical protein
MAKPKPNSSKHQAATLSIPERQLLFCIAGKIDWKKVGITGAAIMAMVIKGLIERDPAGHLHFTKDGRAVLKALVADEME